MEETNSQIYVPCSIAIFFQTNTITFDGWSSSKAIVIFWLSRIKGAFPGCRWKLISTYCSSNFSDNVWNIRAKINNILHCYLGKDVQLDNYKKVETTDMLNRTIFHAMQSDNNLFKKMVLMWCQRLYYNGVIILYVFKGSWIVIHLILFKCN